MNLLRGNRIEGARSEYKFEYRALVKAYARPLEHMASFHVTRSMLLLHSQEPDKALAAARTAQEYNPFNYSACFLLGEYHALRGEYELALVAYRQAVTCDEATYRGVVYSLTAYLVATCPDEKFRESYRLDAVDWAKEGLNQAQMRTSVATLGASPEPSSS